MMPKYQLGSACTSITSIAIALSFSPISSKFTTLPVQAQAVPSPESQLIQSVGNQSKPLMGSKKTTQNFPSVAQFSDVKPSDWAYTALQSLTERYGCIGGSPDKTFKGQAALTRYEFAAGLNACLDKINSLLATGLADKAPKDDLAILQRLQQEFAAELATLKGRVDGLEAKTAALEAQQFSTTTKLFGQAIAGLQGRLGSTSRFPGTPVTPVADPATNVTLGQQVQLSLITQFSDRSILLTGLQAGNLSTGAPRSLDPSGFFALNNNFTNLGYEGDTGNTFILSDLTYRFLVGSKLAVVVGAKGVNAVNIFRGPNRVESAGQGPISVFAQRNPIIALNAGEAGIGFDWQFNKRFSLQGVYSAGNAGNSTTGGLAGGQYSAGIQLAANPSDNLDLSFYYLNSYTNNGTLGSPAGDNAIGNFGPLTSNPSRFSTNAFGSTISWAISRKISLGGWIGLTTSSIQNNDSSGSVETLNWMTFTNVFDLFKDGDVWGVYVGQPPKIISSELIGSSSTNIPSLLNGTGGGPGGQSGTTTHIETFYRFPISKNISVTPGLIFILNPGHNSGNDTITIGVLRTTFTF